MSTRSLSILQQVVDLPTAPFAERHVVQFIRAFVERRPPLALRADKFGNLLVRFEPAKRARPRGRPILFAAHMDHPGFIAARALGDGRLKADFRGWVSARYFTKERVRFFSEGRWTRGRVERIIPQPANAPGLRRAGASARSFGADSPPGGIVARVDRPVAPGSPGMWDLPDASIRGDTLRARACDDLAGLAAVLCALDELCRTRGAIPCFAFFTRAEEVGFAGALAAVKAKLIPHNTVVVAVECSKAVAGVEFGAGPVLRVGDKASVFCPASTAYCQVVAETLAARDASFRFQRKLMDGGTCESTAYYHYGYSATGICLPLGNYHNMETVRRRIGPETIDTRDFLNLVKWFVALARSPATLKFDGRHPGLSSRLESLLAQHRPRLLATRHQVLV